MTSVYSTDRVFMTRRSGVVNHLKNGGFMTYRSFTPVNNAGPSGEAVTRVLRTQYTYSVQDVVSAPSILTPLSVPGFFVAEQPPAEQVLGYWDVWGTKAQVHINRERRAYDGGNQLTVSFYAKGEVTLRQTIESYHKFLGKPVTIGLSGSSACKGLKLTLKIDTGVQLLESRSFFSDYFGEYYRMLAAFEIPLGATKFDVMIQLTGASEGSLSLSGAILALGSYAGEIPFSDSLSDVALPSGTIIGWAGEACPAGFRSVGDDVYLLQTLGDPNAVRGNLYTQPQTTVGTLGPRGDLTLGDHTHKHLGNPSSLPGTCDLTGVAFDKAEAYSAPIEIDGNIHGEDVRARSRNNRYKLLIDRVGPPSDHNGTITLDLVPEGSAYLPHKHAFRFPEETIEPPRVRMHLCEKI